MSDEKAEYEVGYGRPPQQTRFQPGRSGNPAGRPKGAKNVATIFSEVTQELIQVTENGRQRTVTKLEAIMRQLIAKALSGDLKAMKEFMQLQRLLDDLANRETVEAPYREKDDVVMRSILARMSASKPTDQQEVVTTIEESLNEPTK